MFFLEFLITNKCNKNCYYCDFEKNYDIKVKDYLYLDIDKILSIIHIINCNFKYPPLYIEISGGEPGLISNLKYLIDELLKFDNIKKLQIMSNGLVRKLNLIDIDNNRLIYNEHLIYDINKDIIKFYDMGFLPEELYNNFYSVEEKKRYKSKTNKNNIIVMTQNTTHELYENKDMLDYLKQFSVFKLMFPVNENSITEYTNKLIYIYTYINDKFTVSMLNNSNNDVALRKLCSKYSHNACINIDDNCISQCALQYKKSLKFLINDKNLLRFIQGVLFPFNESMCGNCYFYDIDKNKSSHIINAKLKKKYQNRSFGWVW